MVEMKEKIHMSHGGVIIRWQFTITVAIESPATLRVTSNANNLQLQQNVRNLYKEKREKKHQTNCSFYCVCAPVHKSFNSHFCRGKEKEH